jgi:predicted Fe-S protein YdhL (DUF1289 family)
MSDQTGTRQQAEDDVASPCIRACQLTSANICAGCGRSLDEIVAWSEASPSRRRAIVIAARARKASAGK